MSWFLNSLVAFFSTICILTVLGYGIFSLYLSQSKVKIQFTKFEYIGISLGLGIAIYPTYFYILDLVGHSNFIFMVIIPVFIGILSKLVSIRINLRQKNQSWGIYWCNLKITFLNYLHSFRPSRKGPYVNIKSFWTTTAFKIIAVIIIYFFFSLFHKLVSESSVQMNPDSYFWISRISDFRMDPYLNYNDLMAYPFGAIIIGGLFLTMFPETSFSAQYLALKWFPIFILIIYVILLIPIFRRIEHKKVASFCIVVTIVFQTLFLFRTMSFLPTNILNIQFEVIFLIFLIDKFPKPILYFILGSMILYHPIYAGFSWVLYFGYNFLEASTSFLKRFKKNPKKLNALLKEFSNLLKPLKELKTYIKFLLFLAPLMLYMISMTVQWRPDWMNNYLYFFSSQYPTDNVSSLLQNPNSTDPVTNYFYVLIERFSWLNVWGNVYFVLIIIGLFLNFTTIKSNTTKSKFIKFAKACAWISILITFLPSIMVVLQPFYGIPMINQILTILNSTFYRFTAERMYEITNVINVFFVVSIIEELLHRYGKKYFPIQYNPFKKAFHRRSKKRIEQLYWVLFFFQLTITYSLPYAIILFYWRIASPTPYTDGFLFFRDYLDEKEGNATIGYPERNANISLLLRTLFKNYDLDPIGYSLNTTSIQTQFLENASSTIDYLVLDSLICQDWQEILNHYSNSNYTLYSNHFMMILIN